MKKFATAAAALAIGVAALAASTAGASAAVVCNRDGECWHVKNRYAYKPEFGITVHPEGWRWGANDHYKWREHEGRGYWRNGVWIRF
jgi:hypothetical protein